MGSRKATIGYKYYLGAHLVLCQGPVDEILRIDADEREAWSGSVTGSQQIAIDKPELFGGEKKQGGVQGAVDILMGETTQTANDYLQAQLGTPLPAFRGVVSLVLRRCYVAALNPYIKPWAVLLKRMAASGWHDTKKAIGGDANPAHILYEVLTADPEIRGIGLGLSPSSLDDTGYRAVADALHAEGFGLSFQWRSEDPVEGLIQMVLDHIGATQYLHPATGLMTLKLIRNDYTVGSLPVFDESNILRLESFQRRTLSETVNEITVEYTDPDTHKATSVTVQDLANIQAQGQVVSASVSYPAIRNHVLAAKVARRDLVSRSAQLAKVRITVNRAAFGLHPGDPFVFAWPPLGITQLVCRVGEIREGGIESATVEIEAVEDVFGLPAQVYTGVEPIGWTDPASQPAPCPRRRIVEAPYWEVAHALSEADLDYLDALAGFLQTLGERPSGDATNYDILAKGAAYERVGTGDFTPVGTLQAGIPRATADVIVTLAAATDLALVEVPSYGYLDDEAVKIKAINGLQITLARAILDTVPAAHSAGAVLWFAGTLAGADPTEYASTETVYAKLLPTTSYGTLASGAAPEDSLVMAHRQIRPYPPAAFRVNYSEYPEVQIGNTVVAWTRRDRTQQIAYLVEQNEAHIGPEAGTTYRVIFRGEGGGIIRQDDTLTTVDYTYTAATEISDSSLLMPASNEVWSGYTPPAQYRQNTQLTIELAALRSGYISWQQHSHTVQRDGWGYHYGNYYGGH